MGRDQTSTPHNDQLAFYELTLHTFSLTEGNEGYQFAAYHSLTNSRGVGLRLLPSVREEVHRVSYESTLNFERVC